MALACGEGQYAYRLGVDPAKIVRGLYGIDYTTWSALQTQRLQSAWPRSFLYVGRYTAGKAVDILVRAYSNYRSQVTDPWPLVCCGKGPLEFHWEGVSGIVNRGFLQPAEMNSIWQTAGVFILPSRSDPWPLALVEAAAAGLPILCTDACGSGVEVVRPWYNGLIIPPSDVNALTQALLVFHHYYDELPTWGQRSQQSAAPYASEIWAIRWKEMLQNLSLSQTTEDNLNFSTITRTA
ncbi:glycosyltransferase family 4 protein [Leptolyngbya sp. 7M]|uniref:glycosyltransferase family 4 protein n=1 Tax=Leptolyngbya sp. 7M TaxID=2812896 RepID=UPI001B8D3BA3|nr:glycosyltransferase family 4 protein [Leptolyngbya sp. 7M]QYO62675.1 glycosyltransferase family 4 protein [Leptolyngbya sp. 7M]